MFPKLTIFSHPCMRYLLDQGNAQGWSRNLDPWNLLCLLVRGGYLLLQGKTADPLKSCFHGCDKGACVPLILVHRRVCRCWSRMELIVEPL